MNTQKVFLLATASLVIMISTSETRAQMQTAEIKLVVAEKDTLGGDKATFFRTTHDVDFAGDYPDLGKVNWNDKVRSLTLYGPPGTTIQLFDSSEFKLNDDAIEVTVPPGKTQVIVNQIDAAPVTGVKWIHDPGNDRKGLAGKVSSIRWK